MMPMSSLRSQRHRPSVSSEGDEDTSTPPRHQPGQHDQRRSLPFTGTSTRPQRFPRLSVSIKGSEEDSLAAHHHPSRRSVPTGARRSVSTDTYHAFLPTTAHRQPHPQASRQRKFSMVDPDQSFVGARKRKASLSYTMFLYRQFLEQASSAKPMHHFRAYGRLALICIRLCRISQRNMKKELCEIHPFQSILNVLKSNMDTGGVFFDISDFKADTQHHLPHQGRRVLQTKPESRTRLDIAYLLVALRNITAFAEYPTRMQEKLCRVAWFESYEANRTIVRERDPPQAFYFILSGAVAVTTRDRQYGSTRTLVTLVQGMSFGELAVISRSRRQASVTSRTYVELLCISAPDFEDIFMAGRKIITDPVHSSFLKHVSFLRNWPVQEMSLHPQACLFHYFNRGQVLVRDSNNSDWIYIVKSGSVSVLKKLHHADACDEDMTDANSRSLATRGKLSLNVQRKGRRIPESPEVFRNNTEADRRLEQSLPGVFNPKERLGIIDYDKVISEYRSRVQPKVGAEPKPETLPPLHTAGPRRLNTRQEEHGFARIDEAEEEHVTSESEEEENEEEEEEEEGEEEEEEEAGKEDGSILKRWEEARDTRFGAQLKCKGVYMGPPSESPMADLRTDNHSLDDDADRRTPQDWGSSSSEAQSDTSSLFSSTDESPEAQLYRLNIAYQRKFLEHVGRKTMADQLDYKGSRDFRYKEVDLNPMFVLVQVLEKGQYFGVSQLVYPDQPSLSLVSNGAEVVILSKKLFLDHASEACIRHIRRTECPFPAEDTLQNNLQDYVNWEAHRARVYRRLVSGIRQKQVRRRQFPRVLPGLYDFRSGVW
ncbi:uncharacterized protein LOC143293722 [Babylonia areolata]|uniref:uncharacterized protein LOC143293722 n=1 Tax=Babylonia areolata TaxID=304850 RepID=UPI003FD27020